MASAGVAYARFAGFDAGAHAAKRQSSLFAWAMGAAAFTFLLAVAIVVQSRLDNGNDAVPTPLMQFFVALVDQPPRCDRRCARDPLCSRCRPTLAESPLSR